MSGTTVPGLMLTDDLIFFSRVLATARSHGLVVKQARSVAALLKLSQASPPGGVLLDLDNETLDLPKLMSELAGISNPRPRVIAYGSHVDVDKLRAAREAGCDRVVPRSQFVKELEMDLPAWISPVVTKGPAG